FGSNRFQRGQGHKGRRSGIGRPTAARQKNHTGTDREQRRQPYGHAPPPPRPARLGCFACGTTIGAQAAQKQVFGAAPRQRRFNPFRRRLLRQISARGRQPCVKCVARFVHLIYPFVFAIEAPKSSARRARARASRERTVPSSIPAIDAASAYDISWSSTRIRTSR